MSSKKIWIPLASLSLLAIASCKVVKSNTAKPVPETVKESGNDTADAAAKIYRASATKVWDLVHTDIDIRFNLKEKTADAISKITVHPYFYATDSMDLDAKDMVIHSVKDGKGQALTYKYDSLQLHIQLPKTFEQRDTLLLQIEYTAMPYLSKNSGSAAISEDRGLYFINTDHKEPYMPVQIWTQGETESNSHWFPTFDKPNFKSTFAITMHVPDSFQTLSNGALVHSVKEAGGQRADTWHQDLPISTYLAMMAAGNYTVAKDSWNGKEVNYYVPVEYGAYAKDIFKNTPEMMTFFSDKLGVPYPWNKYSQVVSYQYVSGAMENVSASLFGAFNLKDKRQVEDDNNDFIIAHELFHQWFGDYVTAESWSNITLNESFADYSEQLWTAYKYGEDARAAYWLQGLKKYLKQAKYNDAHLLRFNYKSQEELFDRISYSKGGLILHYLHAMVGDKAFYQALHLYLTQNALSNGEVAQLRMAFEKVTGQDWNWFFNEWYYKGGHPKLDVQYNYDDGKQQVAVVIRQTQDDTVGLYRLPMKALVISGKTSKELWWDVKKVQDTFIVKYENGQRPTIVPDAAHWVIAEWKDHKTTAQWYTQFQFANDYNGKLAALNALGADAENDTTKTILFTALKDKNPAIRRAAIDFYDYEKSTKISTEWKTALNTIALNDADNKTKALALNALGLLKETSYTTTYELGIADSSYKVASEALFALDKVNHNRALEYARQLHPEEMKGNYLLYQAAEVIAANGEKEDLAFFKNKTLQLLENNRKYFLPAFQTYLINAKDENAYQQGIGFLKEWALKYADDYDGFYYGAMLHNIRKHAQSEAKIATDKAQIDHWKSRTDIAQMAWLAYKAAVTDDEIKESIADLEKE